MAGWEEDASDRVEVEVKVDEEMSLSAEGESGRSENGGRHGNSSRVDWGGEEIDSAGVRMGIAWEAGVARSGEDQMVRIESVIQKKKKSVGKAS